MRRFGLIARRFAGSGRHDTDPLLLLHQDKKMLQVELIGARELFKNGKATDAFVKVYMGTTEYKTATAKRSSDPVWGETFVFDLPDEETLTLEVWDDQAFTKDVLVGTAVTTVSEIKKGYESATHIGRRSLETFFHIVPPEDGAKAVPSSPAAPEAESAATTSAAHTPAEWIQAVIDRSVKAGAEAVGGVASVLPFFLSKSGQQKLKSGDAVLTTGRLYVKFRVAPAKELVTVLPQVVPPAKIPLSNIRTRPRKSVEDWANGLRPPNRMFRIIALDGGGVRGILSAGILRRLVKDERFPKLLEDADLIAGTSTGGILALLFAAGYTPAQAQALYQHHCPKIFTTTPARKYSPFSARYTSTYLESMMKSYFDDLRVDELPLPVMVTSFRVRSDPESKKSTFFKSQGRGWRPCLFSNLPKFGGPVGPDDSLVAEVACRTSAAPTFFPSYQDYVDGAIFSNNPSFCALAKVMSHLRHATMDRIALLSIGSGSLDYFIPPPKDGPQDQDWGLRQWAPYLRNILLDSAAVSLDTNMELLMGHRYCRVNPRLSSEMELDDVSTIPELVRISRQFDLTATENWIKETYYKSWSPEDDI